MARLEFLTDPIDVDDEDEEEELDGIELCYRCGSQLFTENNDLYCLNCGTLSKAEVLKCLKS